MVKYKLMKKVLKLINKKNRD